MVELDTKSLKPGDRVAIKSHRHGYMLSTVKKVTPTGRVLVENGMEFNPDGNERGVSSAGRSRSDWRYLVPYDETATEKPGARPTAQLVAMAEAIREIIADGEKP